MPNTNIDNLVLRGFFARTPAEELNHRIHEHSINDTGIIPVRNRSMSVQPLRTVVSNSSSGDILYAVAGEDTIYSIPGTDRMTRHGGLWSMVPPSVLNQLPGIQMQHLQMPSMSKRSRVAFAGETDVNAFPVFVWHRANLDENFFAGVEGVQPTLLMRNFQAGDPSFQLSSVEPSTIMRGNRFFVGRRHINYIDRYTNSTADVYVYTLEFISASHINEWTAQARTSFCQAVNAIRSGSLAYLLDFSETALTNVVQPHREYYGQALNDGIHVSAMLDTPAPAPDFNWHGIDVINALSMTPVGVQYQETQSRGAMIKLSAQKARETAQATEYEISNLDSEVQETIQRLEELHQQVALARIALGKKNAELSAVHAARARAQAQADTFDIALLPLREKFLTAIETVQVNPDNALNAYFKNMGVVVHRVVMEKDERRYSLSQITPAELIGGGFKVQTIEFETLEPSKLRAINEAGQLVCQRRVCGPYRVLINYAGGGIEFRYRLAHPNGVIATQWGLGAPTIAKIHPHHPDQRLSPIDLIDRWITGACLGELSPALRNSMQSGNPRLAITACLTFLGGALSTDAWGATYKWFPFAENFSFAWTAAVPEHMVANKANLTYYINQEEGSAIIVDDEWALVRHKVNESWTSRWVPRGGRSAHELVLSVLSEAGKDYSPTLWRIQAPVTTTVPAVEQAEEITA